MTLDHWYKQNDSQSYKSRALLGQYKHFSYDECIGACILFMGSCTSTLQGGISIHAQAHTQEPAIQAGKTARPAKTAIVHIDSLGLWLPIYGKSLLCGYSVLMDSLNPWTNIIKACVLICLDDQPQPS